MRPYWRYKKSKKAKEEAKKKKADKINLAIPKPKTATDMFGLAAKQGVKKAAESPPKHRQTSTYN